MTSGIGRTLVDPAYAAGRRDALKAITEDELILQTPARRPIMAPHAGDPIMVGRQVGHIATVRRVVGFTREWTSLALVSFDVDTDEGLMTIDALPDPDGLWLQRVDR